MGKKIGRPPQCAYPRLARLLRVLDEYTDAKGRAVLLEAVMLMHDLPLESQARICARFEAANLREVAFHPDPDPYGVVAVLDRVAALLDRRVAGDEPTSLEWSAAEEAAWDAAHSAVAWADSLWAAWEAAKSAEKPAAQSALWSARSGEEAAAHSASVASWSAFAAPWSAPAWEAALLSQCQLVLQAAQKEVEVGSNELGVAKEAAGSG